MLRRSLRTLSAALLLAASPAFASAADAPSSSPNPDHAKLFKDLDKDGNGTINVDEVPQEHRRLLERLIQNSDKNKDGKLTVEEFSAGLSEGRPQGDNPGRRPDGAGRPAGQYGAEEIFKRLDADGDGKVKPDDVPEERREGFRRMLQRADENGDGAASLEEFRKGFAMMNPQPGTPPAPGTPPTPGRPGAPPAGGGPDLFRALDANADGSLSKEELAKAGEALTKLDKNGDGNVSREEAMPRPDGGRPGTPPAGQPQGRGEPGQILAYMMRQDTNGDKAISKDEAGERMRENFDRIDRNGDGKLDETELKQMIERMQSAGATPGRRPEGGAKPDGERKPETRRPEGDRKPAEGQKPKSDDAPKKD